MTPRFDAIGIVCHDLGATLDFYETLGLDVPAEREGHVEITLANGTRLMFDTIAIVQSFSDWTPSTEGDPHVGLAFLCDTPAEVDAVHSRITGAGYNSKVRPFDAPWGQRYATVIDPAGTQIDLFAALG